MMKQVSMNIRRDTSRFAIVTFVMVIVAAQGFVPYAKAQVQSVTNYGASYGEWSARWWEWALSIPAVKNPVLDPTGNNCSVGQVGNVWFLAGTFGGSVNRTCTIPAAKAIFFPLVNSVGLFPLGNETSLDLRVNYAAPIIEGVTSLKCTLDGRPCAQNLFDFRVQSPIFEALVRSQSLLPPHFYDPAVADGYWLLLAPLKPGPHTLNFGGTSGTFSVDVTYNLTVQ